MSNYTVKNIKTFTGHEGPGYNATLYRDGKKVALVIDDATGGEMEFEWLDFKAPRVTVDWFNYKGEPDQIKCTPEEALLYEHIRGKTWAISDDDPNHQTSPDIYVDELVNDTIVNQTYARKCKKVTLYRLKSDGEGEYWSINRPYSPEVKAGIEKKHGDNLLEIFNERFK